MYVDAFTMLASNQAVSTAAASASEDYMDLGSPEREIGPGEPLALVVNVKVAIGGTGSPTMQVNVEVDDNTSFSSATVIGASRTFAAADLALGAQVVVPIGPLSTLITADPGANENRYLRAVFTLAGTNPTITVDAHVRPLSMVQHYRSYPDNITIS